MSRAATAGFIALTMAIGLVAYRIAEPSHLYVAADNRDLLETIAAGQLIALTAQAPTTTPYVPPAPTKTPRPPTATPLPTWAPGAGPGVYRVAAITATAVPRDEVDAGLLPCVTVTPERYGDTSCEVAP